MGNPLPKGLVDTQAKSWGNYGVRTGIWNILETLSQHKSRATVMVSGIITEVSPESIMAIAQEGHEICGHSWSQDLIPAAQAPSQEAENIERCRDALTSVSGMPINGWISPRGTPSADTPRLLAEHGYTWWGDVFDADVPYSIGTPAGPIAAIPLQMEINDLPLVMKHGWSARDFSKAFRDLYTFMTKRGKLGYIDITFHAHLGGRPAMLAVIDEMLSALEQTPEVWRPTRNEVANVLHDEESE